ncbi:hypothetical protein F5B22DRAFT_381843 [Xylaria bambusicola]|uniref:uncharacterized protein n=1 Tax=Xylaria bambusicola TaxID=326684 RepID=UPI0020078DCF|nr:uncharacterized protein F5B22DRAFT_381843 [Xylaria bambusicola]KAI0508738.1 hypothetical protein F5B22DRAFT_381843 [Xylaria bambusicola]
MTNLGPLTTNYKPTSSARCSSIYLATDSEGVWLERGDTSEGCFPSNFTPLDGYYYSPGICQDSYTYACIFGSGSRQTSATCCPSGYTCRATREANDNAACQSVLESDSSYIGDVISYPNGVAEVIGTTTALIGAGETIYAIGVPVRRAATDPQWSILSTSLDSATTQIGTVSTSSEITTQESIPLPKTSDASGDPASSTPASTNALDPPIDSSTTQTRNTTIGAIVGAVLGALLILAAAAVTLYCIRKRKKRSTQPLDVVSATEKPRAQTPRYELEEQMGIQEMNGRAAAAELHGHWQPVELS